MEYFYGAVVFFSFGLLVFIFFANKRHRAIVEQEKLMQLSEEEKLERERIKVERQQKRRIERQRAMEEEARKKVRQETTPFLQNFLTQHMTPNIYEQKNLVKDILLGHPITVKDLLQHNVIRQFRDGTKYRVGLVKKVGRQEFSMNPEMIEEMQQYFKHFIELISYLKSKGLEIDKMQLQDLLTEEYENYHINRKNARTS